MNNDNKKRTEINKGKILKFAGFGLLTAAVIAGGVHHMNVNHNEEVCYLTRVLGPDHQINAINNDRNNIEQNIRAVYLEPGNYTEKVTAYTIREGNRIGYPAGKKEEYPNGAILIYDSEIPRHEAFDILEADNVLALK